MHKSAIFAVFILQFHIIFCDDSSFSPWENEVFGNGNFTDENVSELVKQHVSSSTSELMSFFTAEKSVVEKLKSLKLSELHPKIQKTVQGYLQSVDFKTEDPEEYVYHAINAYKMVKRAAKWLPKIKKYFPTIEMNFTLPSEEDVTIKSAHGLADILEHFDLDINDLVNGQLENFESPQQPRFFEAKSRLTSGDLMAVANEALRSNYLDGYVQWLKATLKAAKAEDKSAKDITKIKKLIKGAIKLHDDTFLTMTVKTLFDKRFKLRDRPYKAKMLAKSNEVLDITDNLNTYYYNVFDYVRGRGLALRVPFFFRQRIKKLCQGQFQRPAHLDSNLYCFYIHHHNPFLKLGPIKYERLNAEPEIGLYHQLISDRQIQNVIGKSKGSMKATPYKTETGFKSFSKQRTSKVMYMNELLVKEAMELSYSVQNATRFKLYHEPIASENYQIMNYGLGGTISGHYDSQGSQDSASSEDLSYGGVRIITLMIYMTEVELGGRTVFPHAGISVKPEPGSALYWFNVGPQDNLHSFSNHLGCPVLYGNKWIANKWIKWMPQYERFPCSDQKKFYSLVNHQLYKL